MRSVFPYRLPRGLSEGSLITVERLEEGGTCTVRDREGRAWGVPLISVDPGELVWEDGQWVPRERK